MRAQHVDFVGGLSIAIRKFWADAQVNTFNEDLDYAGGSGAEHVVQMVAHIPAAARLLKLVFAGGLTVRGQTSEPLYYSALPMVWRTDITWAVPPYTGYPSGRLILLNRDAGPMTCGLAVQPAEPLLTLAGTSVPGTGTDRTVGITYSGEAHEVIQPMSHGSTSDDYGDSEVDANFHVIGVHSMDGGSDLPYYKYSASFIMRVLYEIYQL